MKNIFTLFVLFALVTGISIEQVNAQFTVTGSTGADGNYVTLTSTTGVFAAINAGNQTGNNIQISVNASSTAEDGAISLNAGNWTTLKIYPTVAGLEISGNASKPLIDLNGADHVTIDGRVNEAGTADLIISNTNVNSTAGTSTIRFINDASNNIVQYCIIKGSSTAVASGVVFLSSTNGTTGNDSNTISNNSITNAGGNRPTNVIYSTGTSLKENSGNIISNNNIFDFLNKGIASNGIQLANFTSSSSVTGNNFYETTSFVPTASVAFNVILIGPQTTNTVVSDNYIGGSTPGCNGAAWNKTSGLTPLYTNAFTAIYANTATSCSVQGNTISNFTYADAGASIWTGISSGSSSTSIGTTEGNTINTITLTGGATNSNFYGINISGAGNVSAENNLIRSITVSAATTALVANFTGIANSGTGSNSINNNTIGDFFTVNSINASSASTGNAQTVYGIYSAGGFASISGNTIANLTNGTTNATPATAGLIDGIMLAGGSNIVSYNTIKNLSIGNANNLTTHQASVGGIVLNYTVAAAQTIVGNTIFNLFNSEASFAGSIIGIYFNGSTTANTVSGNFVHSLSSGASSTANIYGIKINAGATTYSNNIINIGDNSASTVYGIYETGVAGNNNNVYFNTVYIGGSPSTGAFPSYCLFSTSTLNTRNFRNNILSNARSNNGATGSHYAISLAVNTGLTCDYNNYFTSGTGGILGNLGGDITTIGNWQTATTQDASSLNTDPLFASAGGSLPANYVTSASLPGVVGTGVMVDFNESNRTTNIMGALESAAATNTVDVYIGATPDASFPNLVKAFNSINSGNHVGDLTVMINANQNLTVPAVLKSSSLIAPYTSVLIYPTGSGITIRGDLTLPLIDLDGAKNVTIDGSIGGAGVGGTKSLVINNISSSNSAITSTIRFTNDASDNTIQNCIIKGAETSTTSGVLLFNGTNGVTGNDNNLISNNDITSSATRPLNAIYSSGQATSGLENSGNTINANNIFDFFSPTGIFSVGIYIATGSTDWNITGNSFYETTSFVSAAAVEYDAIMIKVGGTYNISGNFIGGSSAGCVGTWIKNNGNTNAFFAINYSPTVANATSLVEIQGNTIQNFSYSNVGSNSWTGIFIGGSLNTANSIINIGTTSPNIIGAATGNNSITFTSGSSNSALLGFYGINITHTLNWYFQTVNIENNIIGSITVANSAAGASNFWGIYKSVATSSFSEATNIAGNTIGSTVTANSIFANSVSAAAAQSVYGIWTIGNTNFTTTISGNTIANMTNVSTNAGSVMNGITATYANTTPTATRTGATNFITGNSLHDLSADNTNAAASSTGSVTGISVYIRSTANKVQTISGNTIYNLINTNPTFAGYVTGIYFSGTTGLSDVSGNHIHSLSITGANSTTGKLAGIYRAAGSATFSNNIITLGGNSASFVYGIMEWSTAGITNQYFNTINISGSPSAGSSASYALASFGSLTRNYRNNIYINTRTNSGAATGTHYAIYIAAIPAVIDYNDYFVSGIGTQLGLLGVANATTLAEWQTLTGNVVNKDLNSISADPLFANAGGTAALDYLPSATTLIGVTGTGITTDYAGVTRTVIPTMGAFEKSLDLSWNGSFDTDWNTTANWTPAVVPVATAKVTIPDVTNDPIINHAISTPASCLDLTIDAGAVVTINTAKALTVNGTLTNNAGTSGLIIKTGGSLIASSAGVAATMERDMVANEWHLISSPVSNAQAGIFTGKYLQYHTESTNSYTDIVTTTDPLTPMRGYALWGGDAGFTASFAGALNTGSQNFGVTNSGIGLGWNLVGNPYPCSIDWSAASGWTKTNVNNSTYVHVNSSSWATYVNGVGTNGGTRYIAPGQGFFVAATAAGTLASTDAVKVHNAAVYFKNSDEIINNLIRLTVSGYGYTDEAVVRVSPDATTGFDGGYDAYKLYGDMPEAAQLYTLGNSLLSINTLPETNSVQVGLHAGVNGTYTIAAPEINNFADVSLEDTKTGIFTDLTKSSYTFSFESSENEERFVLHFSTVGIEEPESENATVYTVNKTVYVDLPDSEGDIFIFNLAGQLVKSVQASNGLNAVDLSNSTGIFMVKVITNKSSYIRKIWLGQ